MIVNAGARIQTPQERNLHRVRRCRDKCENPQIMYYCWWSFLVVLLFIPVVFICSKSTIFVTQILSDRPGDWFSRSGALITMLSIVLDMVFIKKIEALHSRNNSLIKKLESDVRRGRKSIWYSRSQVSQQTVDEEFVLLSDWNRQNQKRSKLIEISYVGVACLGTIIWGFGNFLF